MPSNAPARRPATDRSNPPAACPLRRKHVACWKALRACLRESRRGARCPGVRFRRCAPVARPVRAARPASWR
ncbi:hypothetical protein G6F31_021778 [Rhizopus arrhizus]|nr:hypothetical protein G6F31_021778 [Rhizopus arrhizus]